MQKWVISKWPLLLDILETAKVNQGGEFHKRTADRLRDIMSDCPQGLMAYVSAPGTLEISTTIMIGKDVCQYYKTSFYVSDAKDMPTYRRFTVASVKAGFLHYETARIKRQNAETVERAAYWSVHHFFRN